MKSRILCICSTAAVIGCSLLFTGCATEEDDRLPPGAYVPPAPKPNPPPVNPAVRTAVDEVEPVSQPQPVVTPVEEPAPLPPPQKKVEKPAKQEKIIHVVKKGDSFWKLAAAYGVTVKAITDANPGVAPSKLYVGRKIVIPAPSKSPKKVKASTAPAKGKKTARKTKKTTVKESAPGERYIVRKGDSISKIAARYKVRSADLIAVNKLSVDKPLWVGQKLIIPKSTVKAGKKTSAAPAKGKKAVKGNKAAPAAKTATKKDDALPVPPKTDSKDSAAPDLAAPPDLSVLNEPAAPKAAPASGAAAPAPATSQKIEADISIGAYADKVGFDIPTLKKYNPDLPADGIIRAGTVVKLP